MDIARQIRTDPDEGIRRLAAELGPGLRAFALRLCGSREDADDLYRDLLIALGVSKWKAYIEWAALRSCGWAYWQTKTAQGS